MNAALAQITFLVRDYDEAIAWFVGALGFAVIEDTPLSADKRWVVVGGDGGARMVLARATSEAQIAAIGRQTGERVGFFVTCTDFDATYARMRAAGVQFLEAPRREPYGIVAVFEDLYGGRWDLIEPCMQGRLRD